MCLNNVISNLPEVPIRQLLGFLKYDDYANFYVFVRDRYDYPEELIQDLWNEATEYSGFCPTC